MVVIFSATQLIIYHRSINFAYISCTCFVELKQIVYMLLILQPSDKFSFQHVPLCDINISSQIQVSGIHSISKCWRDLKLVFACQIK